MKTNINWVKSAQKALIESGIVKMTKYSETPDDSQPKYASYPKAFKGYISSLAASIVQSGMIPALSIYESDNREKEEGKKEEHTVIEDSRAENNRALLIDAIAITLQDQNILTDRVFPLSTYIAGLESNEEKMFLHHAIHQALAALKLALRMYRRSDKDKRNGWVTPSITTEQFTFLNVTDQIAKASDNLDGNAGWLFYQDLYRSFKKHRYCKMVQWQNKYGEFVEKRVDVTEEHQENLFAAKLKTLFFTKFTSGNQLQKANERITNVFSKQAKYKSFVLKTLYPGLLLGTGLSHGVKLKSDIKVGFQFDYTTGLPYIPGSSIKGILRSVFPERKAAETYNAPRIAFLKSLLKQLEGKEWTDEEIITLGEQLFEDAGNNNHRDVFLDALMVEANSEGLFIKKDYITPHRSLFLDPVPIQFLKVLPDVQFRFSFLLNAQTLLSVEKRKELYKDILLFVGIGAKTHVGYGHMQFVPDKN